MDRGGAATFKFMGRRVKNPGRLRRRPGTETVGLYADVRPEVKRRFDEYIEASGYPAWAVLEAAINSGMPGPDGYPANWPTPPEVAERGERGYDSDILQEATNHGQPPEPDRNNAAAERRQLAGGRAAA